MKSHDITLVNFVPQPNTGPELPTGCITLISALKKNKFTVDFRDYQLIKPKRNRKLDEIISFFKNPSNIIGISCLSNTLPYAVKVAQEIKESDPRKKIIFGGIGPSLVAKELLEKFSCIDVIAIGDGRESLPKIVDAIERKNNNLSTVSSIAYRKNEKAVFTKRNPSADTETKSLISGLKHISLENYKKAIIVTASGCPYRCTFCCVPAHCHKYQKRDLSLIKDEMLYLSKQKHGPKIFYLQDEAFLLDTSLVYDLLNFIGRKNLDRKISFQCYGRINLTNEEIAKDLSRHNFCRIYYGVESGSNKILKKIKKGFTIEKAAEALIISKKYIKEVVASFICGYPFENKKDFLSTLLYYEYLRSKGITTHLHWLGPLPATELYRRYSKKLKFSERVISDISSPLTSIREIKDLIIKYPHAFPSFYNYQSPSMEFKLSKACGDKKKQKN